MTSQINTITITRPDDWHVHLRDGEVLKDTVADINGALFNRQYQCSRYS
jgi:dihydroorotase